MEHGELTPEAKKLVADAVREIASPVPRSWESIVASICFGVWILTRPPIVSSRIPYLLRRGWPEMTADFVLLAICTGCGLSAARNLKRRGRILGATLFVVSVVLILDWACLLLNWRERWWG